MNKYYDSLNDEVKEYFSILSPEFPEWLLLKWKELVK